MKKGQIIKALSGFYYVQHKDTLYACKGRGLFRNKQITPLVGDLVTFQVTNDEEGYIKTIEERKNELKRPPIANVEKALIVSSIVEPNFSPQLLDRFLVICESKQIEPMVVFTKKDLANTDQLEKMAKYKKFYEKIGYAATYFSLDERINLDVITKFIQKGTTVLMGQSGAGKSTILNTIKPDLHIETASISKRLGRGRHTTRHVEFHKIQDGLVADTPGFSAIDFEHIEAEQLTNYFKEFRYYSQLCKFRRCAHIKEPQCGVKNAIKEQEICEFRYENYQMFLQEILSRKPRYSS